MSGIQMMLLGVPVIETQTVTVGTFSAKGVTVYGFVTSVGSIADGTFDFVSNAVITNLSWTNLNQLNFEITGVFANSGWTTVTISGTDFLRSAATFTTQVSPPRTLWSWSGASNVFGTTVGATVPAVFTQ